MEAGFWAHAMRTVKLSANSGIQPVAGFAHAHDLPADFVRKYVVSASDTLEPPLDGFGHGRAYLIEAGHLWSGATPLYLRYTSNDPAYGLDLGRWPERLAEAAATELAWRIAPKLTGSGDLHYRLMALKQVTLGRANTFEALQQPPQRARAGNWVTARFSNRAGTGRWV